MSFYCHDHNWSNPNWECPKCFTTITTSSDVSIPIPPGYPRDIQQELRDELSRLREENTRLRSALEFYAEGKHSDAVDDYDIKAVDQGEHHYVYGKRARAALKETK